MNSRWRKRDDIARRQIAEIRIPGVVEPIQSQIENQGERREVTPARTGETEPFPLVGPVIADVPASRFPPPSPVSVKHRKPVSNLCDPAEAFKRRPNEFVGVVLAGSSFRVSPLKRLLISHSFPLRDYSSPLPHLFGASIHGRSGF